MLFDDAFVQSLPSNTAHAVLKVYRHFRIFNDQIADEQVLADKNRVISDYQFSGEDFEDYLRAHSFLQSFAKAHDLNVNISQAPLSPGDLMDQRSLVDRARDAYSSLESIYYEAVATLARDHFDKELATEIAEEDSKKKGL